MIKPITPMHAMTYSPLRLQYPFWIQPKLRGVFGQLVNGRVYSRTKKEFGVLEDMPVVKDCIIFGELWHPRLSQQEIQGALNRIEPNEHTHMLKLHCFDLYYPDVPSMTYAKRHCELMKITIGCPELALVLNQECMDPDKPYHDYLNSGMEGAIYRNPTAPYIPGVDTYDVMKRKPWKDDEGVIIDIKEGKGKLKGSLGNFTVQWHGLQFDVGGGDLTYDLRDFYWRTKPLGKQLTFRYQYLSHTGKPQHPQFVCIREIS